MEKSPQTELAMRRIVDLIRELELSPDKRLPSERRLEQQLQFGRTTLNKAVACLIAQGRLRRVGYKLYPSGFEPADAPGGRAPASLAAPPIHVIEPPYSEAISHDLLEAAHDVAERLGTHTIPMISRSGAEQCRQLSDLLRTGTDGFVLWPLPDAPVEPLMRQFRAQGVPFVLCDLDLGPFDFVGVDNEQGTRLAVEHLHALGHRRMVYVTQPLRIPSLRRRCDGYVQRCQALSLRQASRAVIEVASAFSPDIDAGFARFRAEFKSATAAVFSNDWAAIHFMRLAKEAGMGVPDELSIVGFDGIDATAVTTPAITTVAQNFHHAGIVATQLLFHLIDNARNGRQPAPYRLRVEPQLILRQSTARRA